MGADTATNSQPDGKPQTLHATLRAPYIYEVFIFSPNNYYQRCL